MTRRYTLITVTILIAAICIYLFFYFAPAYQDSKRNVISSSHQPITPAAQRLHNSLLIADLHADSLLWNRNLNNKYLYGHIDFPRMIEGNHSLQVFSVVTKTPKSLNIYENDNQSDNITLLAIAQRWPYKTWGSLFQRAIYQAEKLHKLKNNSPTPFFIIKSKIDLTKFLEAKKNESSSIAGLLSLEGGHALENDLDNVDKLFSAGFRIIGFTHFFDNELGGSVHGINKHGITNFGIDVLRRMENLNMIVDVSHASPKLIDDIVNHSTKPVIATHTGIKHTCNRSPRNLTNHQIKAIVSTGGIIGVGFWPNAICTKNISGIISAILYLIDLVGEDYIALGSDFDGNVQTPFDIANINILTQALLDENLSETQIAKIMGENVKTFLMQNLPNN